MRRAWIVLLMIALMPVRGWALVTMAGSMPAVASAAIATAPDGSSGHAMPCHGSASPADARGSAPTGAAASHETHDAPSAHLCQSCDLCHSPLAATAPCRVPAALAASGSVTAGHARDTGQRLAGRLERPPRG